MLILEWAQRPLTQVYRWFLSLSQHIHGTRKLKIALFQVSSYLWVSKDSNTYKEESLPRFVIKFSYACEAFWEQWYLFRTRFFLNVDFLCGCLCFVLLIEKDSRTSVWHSDLEGPEHWGQTASEHPGPNSQEPQCATDTPVHPARDHKEWGEAQATDFP